MVRHKRINEPDIRYDGQNLFQFNALTDPPESEDWTTIKLRTSIRYFHHKPKA